jgi:sigma-B regulation protein RsbU (phosphoserine phosphatase)
MLESNENALQLSTLPLRVSGAPAIPAAQTESPSRILVVDDNETSRKLLQVMFSKENYGILEAEDGAQALSVAAESSPDLIVLDIMMPSKDGFEVCAELKADPNTRDIPVIFLSAKSETEDKIKGLELGAVDFITKPFSRGEILARIRLQLEVRRLAKSLQTMNGELLRRQNRIQEDLRAAANIQRSLIPPDELKTRLKELELAWHFLPCESVGGDVFNFYRLDEDHVGLFVVDVSGHGVPSAMVTVSVAQLLSPQGGELLKMKTAEPPYYRLPRPAEVFHLLDEQFPLERFQKYFTISYVLLNMKNGRVVSCRAAHPAPLVIRANGEVHDLMAGGTIIGFGDDVVRTESEIELSPGDRIVLYSDGLLEYPNPAGERFGDARLREALVRTKHAPLQKSCDAVVQEIFAHSCGLPPPDDMTIFALEYRGPGG